MTMSTSVRRYRKSAIAKATGRKDITTAHPPSRVPRSAHPPPVARASISPTPAPRGPRRVREGGAEGHRLLHAVAVRPSSGDRDFDGDERDRREQERERLPGT